ncbi:hypothetical protein Dip518_001229 [Parelusimicrobium proximum]|uniref:sulfatase-like hydrolase/transferase n=1 Tax=Parelusimicrobium proximum TaxID=3228953 RepID=UPI003D17E80C
MKRNNNFSIGNIFTFALLNTVLWAAMSWQYYNAGNYASSFAASFFSISLSFGHLFVPALAVFIIVSALRVFGSRAASISAAALGTFFTLLLAIDIFVFTQYKLHITPSLAGMFLSPAVKDLVVFPLSMYITIAAALIAIAALQTAFVIASKKIGSARLNLAGLIFMVFCFLAFNFAYALSAFKNYTPVLMRAEALPYVHPFSMNSFLRKAGFKQSETDAAVKIESGVLNYPKAEMTCSADGKQMNILLILIDSLRADAFNETVMPNLHKRAEKAHVFTNHFSGSNSTRGGVFSFFYGIPVTYWKAFLTSNKEPVLMTELRKRNYNIGVFASATLVSPEFSRTIFAEIPNLRLGSKGETKSDRDKDSVKDFNTFLDKQDGENPFFTFMFLDAPHGFDIPEDGKTPFEPYYKGDINYFALNNDTDPAPYINKYKNSVYNIDIQLEEIMSDLEKRGIADNTIIMISADHGQEINDTRSNTWGHNSNFARFQTQVPMIVFWPGKGADRHEYMTSHFDVAPTIIQDALRCANPVSDYSTGDNLFNASHKDYLLFSGYSDSAVFYKGNIFVLSKYGFVKGYDTELAATDNTLPPQIFKEAVRDMSTFYKN